MASLAQLDGNYFMCNYEDFKTLADELHQFKDLTLEQRYQFCTAPVQVNNEFARKNFVHVSDPVELLLSNEVGSVCRVLPQEAGGYFPIARGEPTAHPQRY